MTGFTPEQCRRLARHYDERAITLSYPDNEMTPQRRALIQKSREFVRRADALELAEHEARHARRRQKNHDMFEKCKRPLLIVSSHCETETNWQGSYQDVMTRRGEVETRWTEERHCEPGAPYRRVRYVGMTKEEAMHLYADSLIDEGRVLVSREEDGVCRGLSQYSCCVYATSEEDKYDAIRIVFREVNAVSVKFVEAGYPGAIFPKN